MSWDVDGKRQEPLILRPNFLNENLVAKMDMTERIDQLIVNIAEKSKDRCVTARWLKQYPELAEMVENCYSKYLNDRLTSLTRREKFIKVAKGVYQLTSIHT